MKVQKAVWASVLAMTVAVTLTAQAPKPSFEVGSVRPSGPSTPSSDPVVRVRPGGVFHPTHATIESLLVFAYDLRPYRIVGGQVEFDGTCSRSMQERDTTLPPTRSS